MTQPDINALIQELESPGPAGRRKALTKLGMHPKEARPALPALIRMLKDEDTLIQWKAASLLRELGLESGEDIFPVVMAHDDERESVRKAAAHALGGITPAAFEAVPSLIELLSDRRPLVREAAVFALGKVGPQATEAVEPLKRAVRDSVANVRLQALVALRAISSTLDGVVTTSTDLIRRERDAADREIGDVPIPASAATPSLYEMIRDEQPQARRAAIIAMGVTGAGNQNMVLHLSEALKDENPKVREAAVYALGLMGEVARPSLNLILNLVKDENDFVRKAAFAAIHKIAKKPGKP